MPFFFFFFFLFLLFREKLLLFVFFFDFLFFSPDLARLLLFSLTPLFFLLLSFSIPALSLSPFFSSFFCQLKLKWKCRSENGAAAVVEWKARFDWRCCRLGFVGGNGGEKNSRVQYGLGRRRIRAAIR
ncbi:hypothetical protein RchiOBHm_Chr1g0382721 [Rosa chinensis]|uniref:Uncharacterized protein n=1 Tax=Rosa chinensis TaxID=74649 RepID=A0A2P6SPI0_ROSCH|nr:hypothetical protein RchiOBHm_Chr1g0382721 [Rosa chinensis]